MRVSSTFVLIALASLFGFGCHHEEPKTADEAAAESLDEANTADEAADKADDASMKADEKANQADEKADQADEKADEAVEKAVE
jgi:hypothetical protein